ncbi:hypothetical protein TeGR_g1768, partial [Tetraparma gracilis]
NGENVEPQPLEDAILSSSPLIDQIMVTDDASGKKLVGVAVLSLAMLVDAGLASQEEADLLQPLVDKMNDPVYDAAECAGAAATLKEASDTILDSDIKDAVAAQLKASTKASEGFRKFEQVTSATVTLEPFAMCNGLLTQSFKVKRAEVAAAFEEGAGEKKGRRERMKEKGKELAGKGARAGKELAGKGKEKGKELAGKGARAGKELAGKGKEKGKKLADDLASKLKKKGGGEGDN